MANIRYTILQDKQYIRHVLLDMGMPIDEAAHKMGVPYACLRYQVRQWTAEDQAKVKKTRKFFSRKEKMAMLKDAKFNGKTIAEVAKENGVAPSQLHAWRKQFRLEHEARKAKEQSQSSYNSR